MLFWVGLRLGIALHNVGVCTFEVYTNHGLMSLLLIRENVGRTSVVCDISQG
jgi:hypothetical protein